MISKRNSLFIDCAINESRGTVTFPSVVYINWNCANIGRTPREPGKPVGRSCGQRTQIQSKRSISVSSTCCFRWPAKRLAQTINRLNTHLIPHCHSSPLMFLNDVVNSSSNSGTVEYFAEQYVSLAFGLKKSGETSSRSL